MNWVIFERTGLVMHAVAEYFHVKGAQKGEKDIGSVTLSNEW